MTRGSSVSAESPSDSLRDQAIADLDALIEIAAAARNDIRAYQTALEKSRRHLARGGRSLDMAGLFDVASVRAAFTDQLNRIERARGISRISLWRLQLSEGTTIAEIARTWGFSRQLVSRALTGRAT